MSRTKLLFILVFVGIAAVISFNLWFSPPPSASTVRRLLEQQPMPGVSSTITGTTVGTVLDAQLQVQVVDTVIGIVAVYASSEGFGSARLERTPLGWDLGSQSWGPLSALTTIPSMSYEYRQEFDYTQFRNSTTFDSAELFWGFRRVPQAQSAIITYSSGATTSYTFTQDFFSIITDTSGVMCSIQVADEQGNILDTITLKPKQPAWIREPKALCR